jgi:hypothetical protein
MIIKKFYFKLPLSLFVGFKKKYIFFKEESFNYENIAFLEKTLRINKKLIYLFKSKTEEQYTVNTLDFIHSSSFQIQRNISVYIENDEVYIYLTLSSFNEFSHLLKKGELKTFILEVDSFILSSINNIGMCFEEHFHTKRNNLSKEEHYNLISSTFTTFIKSKYKKQKVLDFENKDNSLYKNIDLSLYFDPYSFVNGILAFQIFLEENTTTLKNYSLIVKDEEDKMFTLNELNKINEFFYKLDKKELI